MARKQDLWERVLSYLGRDITRPVNYISATEIKVATRSLGSQEEPRLMASMDSESLLPDYFRRNHVFLVPVSRGNYALVHGKGFQELTTPQSEETFVPKLPIDLSSLTYGTGESRYLLHAFHSGLLSHFSGVGPLYPTILGKMGSEHFSFHVGDSPDLLVEGAGMEVDMGFESEEEILLVEAKVHLRPNFLLRQLYYPFRTFSQVSHKTVRPMFFVAEPATTSYALWEFEWTDPADYGAVRLKKSRRYRLTRSELPEEQLEQIEADPGLSIVPQADNLSLVRELPALVDRGITNAKSLATLKRLHHRQGNYYGQAGEALGLIKRERLAGSRSLQFVLTDAGRRFLKTPPEKKNQVLMGLLMRNPSMNAVFRLAVESGSRGVTESDLVDFIKSSSNLTNATPKRRSRTILAYFRWLSQVSTAVVVKDGVLYAREGWDARGKSEGKPAA